MIDETLLNELKAKIVDLNNLLEKRELVKEEIEMVENLKKDVISNLLDILNQVNSV